MRKHLERRGLRRHDWLVPVHQSQDVAGPRVLQGKYAPVIPCRLCSGKPCGGLGQGGQRGKQAEECGEAEKGAAEYGGFPLWRHGDGRATIGAGGLVEDGGLEEEKQPFAGSSLRVWHLINGHDAASQGAVH